MKSRFTVYLLGCEITAASPSNHVLAISGHTATPTASCPHCRVSSQCIHGHDIRCPRDLLLWENAVRLVLHIHRFGSMNAACTVQTFADRLPQVVRPAVQHTVRLTTGLQHPRLAPDGEAGIRRGTTLSMAASPDTFAAHPSVANPTHGDAQDPWCSGSYTMPDAPVPDRARKLRQSPKTGQVIKIDCCVSKVHHDWGYTVPSTAGGPVHATVS
jgi:hypothetical protein